MNPRTIDVRAIGGALLVLVSRLLTYPRSPWEADEFLFLAAIRNFEPLKHHPHPPGYPVFVGLGKAFNAVIGDPFQSLVALSVIACVIGWIAFYRAFRNYVDDPDLAAIGAIIFYFSAGMLVHSTLALADATALMFLGITFWMLSGESTDVRVIIAAASASAAIGARPQLAVPLLPALLIALFFVKTWKQRATAVAVFAIVTLAWLDPLVQETGGWNGFVNYELAQAKYAAAHDADLSRGSKSIDRIIARFTLRPWGSTPAIVSILLLCGAGIAPFARKFRRGLVPLLVFTVIHLIFEIAAMDPADAVRYSLPAMPLVALIAACGVGTFGGRGLRWTTAAVFAALSAWFVAPMLIDRVTNPSPIVAAANHINATAPPNTLVLYQAATRSEVEWLLPKFRKRFVEEALADVYEKSEVPVVFVADGAWSVPDGKVFAWKPSWAYAKMTRNFGRAVTVDPIRPEERFRPERGVYAFESTDENESWRWLAPDAQFRVPALGKREVHLTLALSHDAPYESNDVKISVNGKVLTAARVQKKKSVAHVPLPGGEAVVGIVSMRSFRPADTIGNRDPRLLSVQLVGLQQH